MSKEKTTVDDISSELERLSPFYHNIDLGNGIFTDPKQLTPARGPNYQALIDAIPQSLVGMSVLDIGCNAGAFSIEAKRRGADRVVGIDYNKQFIDQARFCARVLDLDIHYEVAEVFEFLRKCGKFDLIMFIGVLYHLQDPIGVARLIRRATGRHCLLETVGVSSHLRTLSEGIIQFPRPRITHSGSTWINVAGLRHIFLDVAGFEKHEVLFDGSRIGMMLS